MEIVFYRALIDCFAVEAGGGRGGGNVEERVPCWSQSQTSPCVVEAAGQVHAATVTPRVSCLHVRLGTGRL
ncbi:hypothetical protein Pmani_025998 [Petrolisthes manimaculis]|uniref:Uncharacterized protein n=1 Tax=Petrolisthes manimaculis TaxID=1843537 RepID=A0AAE1P6W0_9EUCA|nr:hypothetical protein Pmani_025998 [Petrolisthes manimaculis]